MIKKRHLKSRPVCKLTFELPDYEADQLELLGTFSDWEPVEFNRLKSGKWKLQLEVEPGSTHQFRYRAKKDGETWYDNDGEADDYVYNEFGTQNAVLHC
jgi:hypothetical protein